VGPEGLEQSGLKGSGGPILEEGGAKCGAIQPDSSGQDPAEPEDAGLLAIIEAWPGLSAEKRELVLGIVRI